MYLIGPTSASNFLSSASNLNFSTFKFVIDSSDSIIVFCKFLILFVATSSSSSVLILFLNLSIKSLLLEISISSLSRRSVILFLASAIIISTLDSSFSLYSFTLAAVPGP